MNLGHKCWVIADGYSSVASVIESDMAVIVQHTRLAAMRCPTISIGPTPGGFARK